VEERVADTNAAATIRTATGTKMAQARAVEPRVKQVRKAAPVTRLASQINLLLLVGETMAYDKKEYF